MLQGYTNLLKSKLQDSNRITGRNFHTDSTQTVGITAQYLVAPGYVHPWFTASLVIAGVKSLRIAVPGTIPTSFPLFETFLGDRPIPRIAGTDQFMGS